MREVIQYLSNGVFKVHHVTAFISIPSLFMTVIFHCVGIPYFFYTLAGCRTFGVVVVFSLFHSYKNLQNRFLCEPVFLSLEYMRSLNESWKMLIMKNCISKSFYSKKITS